MQVQSEEKFKECCQILKNGDFLQAHDILNSIIEEAIENPKIEFAVNCFSFWTNIIHQLDKIDDCYERAEILLTEWTNFQTFITNPKYRIDDFVLYCFKTGVFTLALQNYETLLNVQDFDQRAEICRKIGLCYKKIGQYETAKNCLAESNRLKSGVSAVIAELADCFALCGEDRQAKVLFREAFFIDPLKVNLSFLDSELIMCLIKKVEEKGYSGSTLQAWIPVYGQIFGLFTVKRQLRPQEVSKLRQEIYAAENEMKDPSCNTEYLTPRLCNLYFWIIDHYAMNREENSRINEILQRLKILDRVIYELYVK
ncbi:MAG: hypothetical protein KBT21_07190 [Treponema sp.]|nr:hypothetical protein [Candidatus Treponema merdequi]